MREATDRLLRAGARTRIELERLEARMPLPPRDTGRQSEPAWRCEVDRLPNGIPLLLVLPQPLEVVEVLAEAVGQGAGAVPQGAEVAVLQAGEGGHAEVEPAIAVFLPPDDELDEHVVHDAVRGIRGMTHEIDRELVLRAAGPHVGEGDDGSVSPHDGDGKAAQQMLAKGVDGLDLQSAWRFKR